MSISNEFEFYSEGDDKAFNRPSRSKYLPLLEAMQKDAKVVVARDGRRAEALYQFCLKQGVRMSRQKAQDGSGRYRCYLAQ